MPDLTGSPDLHVTDTTTALIERLTRQGVLGEPRVADRPIAREVVRARATGSVSELVTEQRR